MKMSLQKQEKTKDCIIRGYLWGMSLPYTIKVGGGEIDFNGKVTKNQI